VYSSHSIVSLTTGWVTFTFGGGGSGGADLQDQTSARASAIPAARAAARRRLRMEPTIIGIREMCNGYARRRLRDPRGRRRVRLPHPAAALPSDDALNIT
jgi:hypothetical protein